MKEYNFKKGKRGAVVPAPKGKTRITIRIDNDILDRLHGEVEAAGGGNYQTLINQALREYLKQQGQPLEEVPPDRNEFDALLKKARKQAKEVGLKPKDITSAVAKARACK